MTDRWRKVEAELAPPETGLAVGMLALSADRVGVRDFEAFLAGVPGLEVHVSRVPIAPVVTPESLAAMRDHLAEATALLVPGSRLDAIAFSCTSGTVACGIESIRAAIASSRPGLPILTPMQAGAKALTRLGARRIALLTPYRPATADLVAGFFEQAGFDVQSRWTFDLDGDLTMNRVSPACLIRTAQACIAATPAAEALFISCTALMTSPVVEAIEQRIGLPVVTSNQALAWDTLRTSSSTMPLEGRGRLFR
jgi:maleate isomerase